MPCARLAAPFALALGACSLGACTLFTSFDGLSNGADTSAADAAAPADGGAPAVDAGDAGADADTRRFCERQSPAPTFCADFDVGPLADGWDDTYTKSGTLAIDSSTAVSAPNALLASVTASGNEAYASLSKTLGTGVTELHVAFDIRPEALGYGKVLQFLILEIAEGPGSSFYYQVGLAFSNAALISFEYAPAKGGTPEFYDEHELAGTLPIGKWTHVTLDLSLARATQSVTFDGAAVLPAGSPIKPQLPSGSPDLYIGAAHVNSGGAASVLSIDDVVADVH